MAKKDLLKEELKRHLQLLEYTFYMEEPKEDEKGDLLLDVGLNEQDPVGDEAELDEPTDTPGELPDEGGEETEEVAVDTETDEGGDFGDETDPFAGEEGMEVEDEFADEGGEDTVEVDVTDIVDKAEATQEEIAGLTAKMDELLGKLGDLESQVTGMDQVITKIDDLETQIEKNNPTPVERLEMRSMDSYPYSVTLTDYWEDKEGYDATDKEEEEYSITQKDVDDYSETEIKKSFDYDENDENYKEF